VNRLNKNLPVPLYYQLRCALMDSIEAGRWQAGDQLPNEGQLAQNFGVSKITVRQALQELAALGYIRREQGRGTFVSTPKIDQGPRELTSFTEEMRRHRLSASSRVLERTISTADARLAETLELHEGEPVFVLKRLRLADGEPMGIQTAHIPVALAPELVNEDLEKASLYEVLRTRYGLDPGRAREVYFAVSADEQTAGLLGIVPGSPVLAVERITLLPTGKPFEFVKSTMRGDRYSIILDLASNRAPQAIRQGATR
jgi:GntR family transcriptional regulator, N-acetylglucosamine utilization regulator